MSPYALAVEPPLVKLPKSSARTRRALSTFTKFMRAYNSLRQRLEPVLADLGVTPTQFGVLEALLHLGPLNQRDLGEKLLTSKGNLSVVIDNLERDGLVERRAPEHDRRERLIHLTPAGERFVREIFPKQAEAIARELGRLTAAELKQLGDLCRKLGRSDGGEREAEDP